MKMRFNSAGRSGRPGKGRAVGVCAAVVLLCLPARAQITGQDIVNGIDFIQRASNDYELDLPSSDELAAFWRSLDGSLQADDIEQLASLKQRAEDTLSFLDRIETARPYADWLRQRLDYIEVAAEVVAEEKKAEPPKPRPGKPAPPAPSPEVRRERIAQRSRSVEVWKRRVEKRAAPAASVPLVPRLKKIFKAQGLPEQLVWVAEVESTMDATARSPAGAAGIFQLMPTTASTLGLRVSPPPDERLDVTKNATAAAGYLKKLRDRFGSWPMALAAYNAGEGAVSKAMKSTGGRTFEAIASKLPAETQMYVPKIDAVIQKREGKSLQSL